MKKIRLPIVMSLALLSIVALTTQQSYANHELEGRDIIAGAQLYSDNCASCHGVNLEGQPKWQMRNDDGSLPAPPHDETGHTWHHDNQLLFNYTKLGGQLLLEQRGIDGSASRMPGFAESLTDDQIWDILAFIQSTWPDEIKGAQASRNEQH